MSRTYIMVRTKWTCPECKIIFTDPAEWSYGHDCEA